MPDISDLQIKLFCDAADFSSLITWAASPYIKGFTTNPTLMRKAQVLDYKSFARQLLTTVCNRPISFEVLADDSDGMEEQAFAIAGWGKNIYVKVPVMNTWGVFTGPLLRRLSRAGVQLNVTAVFTLDQIEQVVDCLDPSTPSIVSVFAGRIADTGINPIPMLKQAANIISGSPLHELLWASPRELLNIFHAEEAGCHIITVVPEILNKLNLIGKNLEQYSLETVHMFYQDACAAGYQIDAQRQSAVLTA